MTYLLSALFAILSGWYDAWCIKRGKPIGKAEHRERWLLRAIVVAMFVMADFAIRDYPGWQMLPKAIGCAFLFSAVFRLALNGWRKRDWRYVAPWSNKYDEAFAYIMHVITWRERPPTDFDFDLLTMYKAEHPTGLFMVHRAGLLAYSVELVVFGLVAWLV